MSNLPEKPKDSMYTDSQWQAIYDKGENILVSASAGSGKTSILVERAVQKILSGVDVDKLLIVTFTEAAASEMKERLEKKIQETLSKTNDNAQKKRLINQLQLLPQANISTLHAFCMTVIRRFYYLIDIDPVFRMMTDETEKSLLKEKIWSELREELYETDGQPNERFYALTSNFSGDRNDTGLQDMVFRLFNFARTHPRPQKYLEDLVANYDLPDGTLTSNPLYKKVIKENLLSKCRYYEQYIEEMMHIAESLAFDKILMVAQTQEAQLKQVADYLHNDKIAELLAFEEQLEYKANAFHHGSKIAKENPEARLVFNEKNKAIREFFTEVYSSIFKIPQDSLQEVMKNAQTLVEELVVVTQRFMERFAKVKREKNSMDFNDLEHFTVQILTEQDENGELNPSLASSYYRQRFEEVLVDEYQDTNMIQETICSYVSKQNNCFMVGDVKQSIYMFRQADPSLFIKKYKKYGKNDGGKRIVLAENFRSRTEVLDFTNLVFTQLMDEEIGEIEYDTAAKLVNGNKNFPENATMQTELLIYENGELEEEIQEELIEIEDKTHGELSMVAMKIRELIDEEFQIYDKSLGTNRTIEYKDIVLLTPTRKHNIKLQEVLQSYYIPVSMNDVDSYFKKTEILTMISLLEIIDNPYQDIPLAAVLRSPIVQLSEDELAQIRMHDKTGMYYEAVKKCKDLPKLEIFKAQLKKWRNIARQVSLHELIWMIYHDTAYIEYAAAQPNGRQRQANLYALAERASQFEESSFRGLFQFIRFIEKMQEYNQDFAESVLLGNENSVRVMTIHGSKGLEFPIVFLMDTSKQWNEQDIRSKYIFDDKLGVGIKYLDLNKRLRYSTIVFEAIKQEKKRKMLSEEMRKLYVALTRAEQKLYIVGSYKDKETALKKWSKSASERLEVLNVALRGGTRNMMDWIGMTLMRHRGMDAFSTDIEVESVPQVKKHPANFTITFINQADIQEPTTIETTKLDQSDENPSNYVEEFQQAKKRLNFSYPLNQATQTAIYQSVSEIKQIFADPDTPNFLPATAKENGELTSNRLLSDELGQPVFLKKKNKKISNTQIGTTTHLILQRVDFSKNYTKKELSTLLEDLVNLGLVEEDVAKRVQLEKVETFLSSEFGLFLQKNAKKIVKERPFSMLIHPSDIFEDYPKLGTNEDDLLIHGIIDGYIEVEDKLTLFDYKTDYLPNNASQAKIEALIDRYRGQIYLYRRALELATGKKVERAVLVLLSIGKTVVVE